MNLRSRSRGRDSKSHLVAYIKALAPALAPALGHADRVTPLQEYCARLLSPGGRNSIERIATRVHARHMQASYQSMHHFVANGDWSDDAVLEAIRANVLPIITERRAIRALIVRSHVFPKKGKHSVGVANQYCGRLGKRDNCQVALSLSAANGHASLPIAYRLFLPEDWTDDANRRARSGVPEKVIFQTMSDIACNQIGAALSAGIKPEFIFVGAEFGEPFLRSVLGSFGFPYVVGITSCMRLRLPHIKQLRPRKSDELITVEQLALTLPKIAWLSVTLHHRSNTESATRFAMVRVRPVQNYAYDIRIENEQWCLIEWPAEVPKPTKYYLSSLAETATLLTLIEMTVFHETAAPKIGLTSYEGRGWRGFHHHATLCIAAIGFRILERSRPATTPSS